MDKILEPYNFGTHGVPGFWQYLLPSEMKDIFVPEERRSSCLNCPKVVTDGFREDARCCTYHPRVANFALGLALKKGGEGRKIIETLLRDGYLTPEGMVSTPQRWAVYLKTLEEDTFGKTDDITCPFLDFKTGYCNIYAFRNSVCSTFYCLHDNGSKGDDYWDKIQTVVSQCELALGQWVMEELDVDPKEYMERLDNLALSVKKIANPKNHSWTEASRKALWKEWYGKELEFFEKCADLVMKHRDVLWEVANSTDILESQDFDKATVSVVPKKYRNQVDEDFLESGDTVEPDSLWKDFKSSHNKMLTLPGGKYAINKKVILQKNPLKDEVDRFYKKMPAVAIFHSKKDVTDIRDKIYLSGKDYKALSLFSNGEYLDFKMLKKIETILSVDPMKKVSEWLGCKILQKIK